MELSSSTKEAKETEKNRTTPILISILIVSAFSSFLFAIPSVKGEEADYEMLSVLVERPYYLRGETARIDVIGNASTAYVLKVYDPTETVVYWTDRQTNTDGKDVVSLPIEQSFLYGSYMVKANVSTALTRTWFTVLDISNWISVVFPYTTVHKGIYYTFYSNGTFTAEGSDGSITLDLSMIKDLAQKFDLTIKATKNDMNFRVRLSRVSPEISIDLDWAFIHKGCKLIIQGDIDQARQFTFKISRYLGVFREIIDGVRCGHLVFDWSDIRKAQQAFSYNRETKELTVNIPKTFKLDPYVFESGFETNDFSEWTGTVEEVGDSSTVQGSIVHMGSYAANFSLDGSGADKALAYYQWFNSTNPFFVRIHFRTDTLPSSGDCTFMIALKDEASANIMRLWIENSGGSHYLELRHYIPTQVDESYQYDFAVDTWYHIEVKFNRDGSNGEYKVYLEDSLVINQTGLDTTGAGVDYLLYVGWSFVAGSLYATNAYVDSVAVDTSYIGPEGEGDSTPPTYSNIATNTTLAGQPCNFTADWDEDTGLSGHIFGWNETGSWANETFVSMTGTSNTSSTVKTLNSTVGKVVGWRVYTNDTSNNWNNTAIQTLTTTGYTLTLQARDKDGTNLPRQVAFKGAYVDGSSFEEDSDSNGLKQLTVAYGTLTANTWWGTHLIDSAHSVEVTGDKTENIDTKIARLNSGSYYILISIKETTIPSPSLVGTKDWKILGVDGSGSKELKMDSSNWIDTNEPEIMKINGNPYETGWTWDGSNQIFTYLLDLSGPAINIEMSWTQPTKPGGTSTTTTTVTVTPVKTEEEAEQEPGATKVPVYVIPEQNATAAIELSPTTITMVVSGIVVIGCLISVYAWYQDHASLESRWNRKGKSKPNWKKRR